MVVGGSDGPWLVSFILYGGCEFDMETEVMRLVMHTEENSNRLRILQLSHPFDTP